MSNREAACVVERLLVRSLLNPTLETHTVIETHTEIENPCFSIAQSFFVERPLKMKPTNFVFSIKEK